jgi:branched-chain amino acid transport system permease protein
LLNAIVALSGYTVIAGGSYSFAFIGFFGVGAYTAGYLATQQGVGMWGEIGAVLVLAFLTSLILGRLLIRLGGVYLAMATVAITSIVGALAVNLGSITGGANGITGIGPPIGTAWLVISVVVLCAGFFIVSRSRLGRAMRLLRADPLLARAMGVNSVSLGTLLFTVSSMIAAYGGVLYAHYYQFVTPTDFNFTLLIDVLAMIIIGGSRHWSGPLVGAALITAIPDWLSSIGVWADVITGGIVLIIILWAPEGIVGSIVLLYRRLRTELVARRHKSEPLAPIGVETSTSTNGKASLLPLDDPDVTARAGGR